MGLLQALNLPRPADQNPAKRRAVRRAERAARFRKGDRREVLNAAIDMAARSASNSAEVLDDVVFDDGNPEKPVSSMAPESAYAELKGAGESKYVLGGLQHERQVTVAPPTDADSPLRNDFEVTEIVGGRGLARKRIGDGQRRYKKDAEIRRLREPDGFTNPASLVMAHEHLHLVIAAHVSKRLDEFADAAFGQVRFRDGAEERLIALLKVLAKEAEDKVDEFLDDTVPEEPEDIEQAEATMQRLLKDGTLERLVRTALLDVLRKNSKKLAAFRK